MVNKEKKYLKSLTQSVIKFLTALDTEMKNPSSYERGAKIAKLANSLEIENDSAMHFGLDLSFDKIKKMKA